MYNIKFNSKSVKQYSFLKQTSFIDKVNQLLDILENNPYQNPPPFKKLKGDLKGSFSRRINDQHRIVYQIDKIHKEVRIYTMWSHYE